MGDMWAKARRGDPETSHQAAREMEDSGRAHGQRALCLEEVKRRPGQTAAEIAAALGLERHVPSRRLPELRAAGLIRNGPARECRVMRRSSLTWELGYQDKGPMLYRQENLFQGGTT